jgi:hypothetical protein
MLAQVLHNCANVNYKLGIRDDSIIEIITLEKQFEQIFYRALGKMFSRMETLFRTGSFHLTQVPK